MSPSREDILEAKIDKIISFLGIDSKQPRTRRSAKRKEEKNAIKAAILRSK